MRHLWSFLLSLVLTPLIYISAGFSAVKFGEAKELGVAAILGLVGAFVAGGLYALLVMGRVSPVGPVFAGLVYLGVTFWAVLDQAGFADTIPADLAGQKDLLHVPVPFGTALLAAPLFFTIFSPRRWRATATAAPASFDAAPSYSPVAATAAPTYSDTAATAAPIYGTATYEPPVYTPPYTPPTSTFGSEPSTLTYGTAPEPPTEGERHGLT